MNNPIRNMTLANTEVDTFVYMYVIYKSMYNTWYLTIRVVQGCVRHYRQTYAKFKINLDAANGDNFFSLGKILNSLKFELIILYIYAHITV